jgi:UDP-arabinose 4-epimerase
MRILVTGGAGYIGSHFSKIAARSGHDVAVFDDLSTGHKEFAKFGPFTLGDIRDTEKLTQALQNHKAEAVVHFAAKSLVAESVQKPDLYDSHNRVGTQSVLKAMQAARVPLIVFSSSAATYGVSEEATIKENHPQKPVNPYGETKLKAEQLVIDAVKTQGVKAALLRYFNVIGHDPEGELFENHEPETHLLPNIMKGLETGRTFQLFGTDYPTPDGTCVRDYVNVNDLGRAHLGALDTLNSKNLLISNVGLGRGYSVREVFNAFEKVVGRAPTLEEKPRRPGDPPALIADATIFKSWYKEPMLSLEESIKSLLAVRKV